MAEKPPAIETSGSIARLYFAGPNLFDLENCKFAFTLFDFPAATTFRTEASFIREDDKYYYFQSYGTMANDTIEWAFTIEPSNAFEGHRVRRKTNADWEDLEGPIVMTFPREVL